MILVNRIIVVKQYIVQLWYSILSVVYKILPLDHISRSWAYIWYVSTSIDSTSKAIYDTSINKYCLIINIISDVGSY